MLVCIKMKNWGMVELCTMSSEMQLALCLPIFSKEDLQCRELWRRARPPCHGQSFSAFISPSLKEMQERKYNGEHEGSYLAGKKTWPPVLPEHQRTPKSLPAFGDTVV